MKKVLDKALEAKIEEIIKENKKDAPAEIVALLKELQDANGVKVCQNVSVEDVAYKEIL